MSAVAISNDQYTSLYRRALEGELNRWGKWNESRLEYEGYPGVNVLVAFTNGGGGGTPGHRILCLDMPTDVYSVHQRIILVLNEQEREAVWLYYVPRMKVEGTLFTPWTFSEKCGIAGVSEAALRMRVSRARKKLMGLIDDDR